jgi:hypothetical protein
MLRAVVNAFGYYAALPLHGDYLGQNRVLQSDGLNKG